MILIDCPAVKSSSHISAHCGECETWHIIAHEERSGFQGALLATTHAYDGLDRLAADDGVAYTYDAAGNRMTRTENGETVTYALGAGDRLASWTGGSYTYNAAGCVTRIERDGRPTLDLAWNGQYQLVSVSTNGVFAEGYAYDALGRRVSTTTQEGTVRHVYGDSWQCLADVDESGNVICSYVWGEGIDKLLAVKIGGESYYPLTDIQGTVWGYADSQNTVVARWTYDAWGNFLSEFCAVPALSSVRYRFQGREWSKTTGLINFRFRWYDSIVGRWLSKDPIGLSGGLNLFAFCMGDSLNYYDTVGLMRAKYPLANDNEINFDFKEGFKGAAKAQLPEGLFDVAGKSGTATALGVAKTAGEATVAAGKALVLKAALDELREVEEMLNNGGVGQSEAQDGLIKKKEKRTRTLVNSLTK